jgi:hypothetical protein
MLTSSSTITCSCRTSCSCAAPASMPSPNYLAASYVDRIVFPRPHHSHYLPPYDSSKSNIPCALLSDNHHFYQKNVMELCSSPEDTHLHFSVKSLFLSFS